MRDIVIFEDFDLDELKRVMAAITEKSGTVYRIRFAIDSGGLKYKVNGGLWSPPGGRMEDPQ